MFRRAALFAAGAAPGPRPLPILLRRPLTAAASTYRPASSTPRPRPRMDGSVACWAGPSPSSVRWSSGGSDSTTTATPTPFGSEEELDPEDEDEDYDEDSELPDASDLEPGDGTTPPYHLPSPPSTELAEALTGPATAPKFKLRTILDEFKWLHKRRFPLPADLSEAQWRELMALETREARYAFLDAVFLGRDADVEALEGIRQQDARIAAVGGVPPVDDDLVEEYIARADDPERAREVWRTMLVVFEDSYQNGEIVPYELGRPFLDQVFESKGGSRPHLLRTLQWFARLRSERLTKFVTDRARKVAFALGRERRICEIKANKHIVYGPNFNSILIRVQKKAMQAVEDWRQIRELQPGLEGQPIVFDLQFLRGMNIKHSRSMFLRELQFSMMHNSRSLEPFAIHLTNYDPECKRCQEFDRHMSHLHEADSPVTITRQSYLDLFPKERLVYLSPDSRNDLMHYDADDIYIVGALHNPNGQPLTLMQAKKEGIRHARLPLKKVVGMGLELNVDHVTAMLLDVKAKRDWFYACRWIPPRYFRNRVHSAQFSAEAEAAYLAHFELSPQTTQGDEVAIPRTNIQPAEYRRRYAEIVRDHLEAVRGEKEWAPGQGQGQGQGRPPREDDRRARQRDGGRSRIADYFPGQEGVPERRGRGQGGPPREDDRRAKQRDGGRSKITDFYADQEGVPASRGESQGGSRPWREGDHRPKQREGGKKSSTDYFQGREGVPASRDEGQGGAREDDRRARRPDLGEKKAPIRSFSDFIGGRKQEK